MDYTIIIHAPPFFASAGREEVAPRVATDVGSGALHRPKINYAVIISESGVYYRQTTDEDGGEGQDLPH